MTIFMCHFTDTESNDIETRHRAMVFDFRLFSLLFIFRRVIITRRPETEKALTLKRDAKS